MHYYEVSQQTIVEHLNEDEAAQHTRHQTSTKHRPEVKITALQLH
jgi:hypothetical protein